MKKAVRPFYVMTLLALLLACGEPNQRLDEYVFYDGPQFRLKVVRYYRNIPFNYLGEHAVVMCQSENTGNYSGHDAQDAGWRMLGEGNTQGSKDAREVALVSKDDYLVFDDHTLIGKRHVFNISFDACGHFINWDPTRLPQAIIDPVEKPVSCAPNGPADCRYYDFEGDRAPRYEQISVAGKGQVNFRVKTPTFKGVQSLRVQTRNNGALWHVDTVGLYKVNRRQARQGELRSKRGSPAGEGTLGCKVNRRQAREGTLGCTDWQRLQPDTIRSLSMSLLEKGMGDVSLMDWLESTLPPRSMVIWPDALTACGEPQGADETCAEIRFNDSAGNSGALSISMAADAEDRASQASFHSAVHTSVDQNGPIRSLTGLREHLVTGTP